jgi:phenylacetate-CoA ligase
MHMRLNELLKAYPYFHFDLEEHLRSTAITSSLEESLTAFCSARSKNASTDSYADFIVQSLNQGACRAVPAYRRISSIGSLRDLPFLQKTDLRERGREYVSSDFAPEQLWIKKTTGSSGPPTQILYSAEFYFDFLLLSLQKVAHTAGLQNFGERPIFCVAVSGNLASREFVACDPSKSIGHFVQILVEENSVDSFKRALRLIEELQPVCVSSKPSVFEMLCSVASHGLDASSAPEIVVSGGAEVSPQLRANLEVCFASRVVDTYGMTEFGLIASESSAGELLIDTSAFAVEVVDEQGHPLSAGHVGELVISSLKNSAMPLLRYKTEDLGALDSTGTRLERFVGRKIRCFKLADGALFSPTYFNDLFTRFPNLAEFQLIQQRVSDFQLLIDVVDRSALMNTTEELRNYVSRAIPGDPTVTVSFGTERGLGKFQRFKING